MTFWERTDMKKNSRKAEEGKPMIGDKNLENALFTKKLSDKFTNQVMLALEEIEIESIQGTDKNPKPLGEIVPYDTSIAAQVKRERTANRNSRLKVWGAAAAAVMLVSSTLLYTQPILADTVRSLFAKDSYVDNGMKNVEELGLMQISDANATDQGYILKVNQVIADSTRLIIGIDVFDAEGNALAGEISTAEFKISSIQKGNFADISYAIKKGGNRTTSRIEFDFMRPVLADKLQLNANIKELKLYKGKLYEGPPIKTIKGDWTLIMEADLAKAKAQTLLTEINKKYETPGGIQIHIQGATRTPSGGSLEFTTKLTPEAAGRAVNGQSGLHKLNYHLEDEQGERLGDSNLFELGNRYELDRWSGVTQWFYQFNNFAYDKHNIRFVLDSYMIQENSKASVILDPAKISTEHPVKFEDSGDILLLEGLNVDPDKVLAFIPIGGTLNNPDIQGDTWAAIDENGKEYSVYFAGGVSTGKSGSAKLSDAFLVVQGLDKAPKQLTIKRIIVNHLYKDADWSFVIPQKGTKGVIPE